LLTLPIQRGIHDINRLFVFKSNPEFIFHDSPRFEAGDKKQLQEVLSLVEKKEKSNEVDDQLQPACDSVGFPISAYIITTNDQFFRSEQCSASFHWKQCCLGQRGQEEVSIAPSFKSWINFFFKVERKPW
jgi:hypothetical protein